MKAWIAWIFRDLFPPVALFGLVLIAWDVAVWWFAIPPFLLPRPMQILGTFHEEDSRLVWATLVTGQGALGGFGLSLAVGITLGLIFSQSRIIRQSCYPYAIFLQTVPIVAIAPLVVTWFGTGFFSVLLVSFIISLFPIITNATAGLMAVDPGLIDLFRINRATRWQTLFKLRFPNSIPHLVTGAKTSAGLAVVGAIVGEFFVGYGSGQAGLGNLILQTMNQMKTDLLFASVIASASLGVAIFGLVNALGGTLLKRWQQYDANDPLF
ncbi:Binding-protein-dependent transport systems inner membrane component [Planctomycetales bacterium 10988]|nr:Binding-protein-dependent transport systems inner membrane component [Planctomycetales bacterium 10988]